MTPDHDLVVATSPHGRQPLHCLLRVALYAELAAALAAGERRVTRWQDRFALACVHWSSDRPFDNINSTQDASRLGAVAPPAKDV